MPENSLHSFFTVAYPIPLFDPVTIATFAGDAIASMDSLSSSEVRHPHVRYDYIMHYLSASTSVCKRESWRVRNTVSEKQGEGEIYVKLV